MFQQVTNDILAIIEREEPILRSLSEEVITTRLNNQNRSIKNLQDYQHEDWDQLLTLWKYYNLHMIQVIKSVDETKLDNYWIDYEGCKVTLRDMITGYTGQLHLHISQIHALIEQ